MQFAKCQCGRAYIYTASSCRPRERLGRLKWMADWRATMADPSGVTEGGCRGEPDFPTALRSRGGHIRADRISRRNLLRDLPWRSGGEGDRRQRNFQSPGCLRQKAPFLLRVQGETLMPLLAPRLKLQARTALSRLATVLAAFRRLHPDGAPLKSVLIWRYFR